MEARLAVTSPGPSIDRPRLSFIGSGKVKTDHWSVNANLPAARLGF
jgi:hypothetical protein